MEKGKVNGHDRFIKRIQEVWRSLSRSHVLLREYYGTFGLMFIFIRLYIEVIMVNSIRRLIYTLLFYPSVHLTTRPKFR